MPTITLEPLATFDEPDIGELVAFSVGFDGLPYVVTAIKPIDYRATGDSGATFAKSKGETPQDYKIFRAEKEGFQLLVTIRNEPFNIHFVQPMPDGRFLLVCARCHYNRSDPERNARIYDSAGTCVSAITLGDGIQDVRVGIDARIWTSYFDEGIFGNCGWDHPLGASGLVAWNEDGKKVYDFEPSAGLGSICDCYAMNTSGAAVWIYYYTEFPLVQIRGSRIVRHLKVPVSGSDAFAISGSSVLFRGGYKECDRYKLFRITDSDVISLAEIDLCDAEGTPIKANRVVGAGDSIFLLRDADVFRISIEAALASTGWPGKDRKAT
ncbi:MAG: hypothetical protein H0X66_09230 [Verrucomicrobia bacterium]|nr:hypothetical protein [Verrucomicrobiota bacterium]